MSRPGVWVANGSPSNRQQMYSWKPTSVVCIYDHLSANGVREYKLANPTVKVIVRFLHPKNWMQDIGTSAWNYANEIIAKWPEIRDFVDYVYFANELNLHYENGDDNVGNQHLYETPEFYQKVADWTIRVADKVGAACPDMKMGMHPFAFGHGEDGAPDDSGNPKMGWAGYDYFKDIIARRFNNIVCGHYYWGDASGSISARLYDASEASWYAFRYRRVKNLFKARYGQDIRLIVDECGNFGANDADFTDQLIYYTEQVSKDNYVLAVAPFLWEDPTNSPGNLPNSWVQRCRSLEQHVARLAALPDTVEPMPQEKTIRVLEGGSSVVTYQLEEYLCCVVPNEMPSTWPAEALKAQAVAARSFAEYAIAHPRHAPIADVCSSTHCQVHDRDKIRSNTDAAVAQTSGQVLLYNGQVVSGYYSANCGGQTVGNETGFGGSPLPYLRPVTCVNKDVKNGHGVGMCQYGAHDMAIAGATYQEILKHYYTGISIRGAVVPPEGDEMAEEIFVNDARLPSDTSLATIPRITTYAQLAALFGLSVDRSLGWDICPEGKQCWKLVGFEVRPGVAEFIPQVMGLDGSLSSVPILVNIYWPDANDYAPLPAYFSHCKGGYTSGGRVGFPYGPGNDSCVKPGGGPFSIWPHNAPPGLEPQYADCAKYLGWLGGTDHLTPNPIFQLVTKPVSNTGGGDTGTNSGCLTAFFKFLLDYFNQKG